jgi:hypothetical protein
MIAKTQYIAVKIICGLHGNIVRVNGICAESVVAVKKLLVQFYSVIDII